MKINIPQLALVILIGPSGSGKTSFAKKHFQSTSILSSDFFRGMISDDENDQTVTGEAFEILDFIAQNRLKKGKLTIIDSTNVLKAARQPLLKFAKSYHILPIAIVFNFSEKTCQDRNQLRFDRQVDPFIIHRQHYQLQNSLIEIVNEGFHKIYYINDDTSVDEIHVELEPLACDRHLIEGPFDIIGDIHGCYDELIVLLEKLGYQQHLIASPIFQEYNLFYKHPTNRKVIFIGDVVNYGPKILETISLISNMVHEGNAYCILGDHERFLLNWFKSCGKNCHSSLKKTLQAFESIPIGIHYLYMQYIQQFLEQLSYHYLFDHGNLIVSHAGMLQNMQGRISKAVNHFCLYGENISEPQLGIVPSYQPEWPAKHSGDARIVYGHIPVEKPQWFNRTVNIDTGCVFGGALTALQYPEKKFISIKANKPYYEIDELTNLIT
ncbi:MAG: AAA family ATPase [Desulfobacterales bacterium]|nr:AAA family ATPase [Desulfobacterales bacterium]